jgi:hypothetical protein
MDEIAEFANVDGALPSLAGSGTMAAALAPVKPMGGKVMP